MAGAANLGGQLAASGNAAAAAAAAGSSAKDAIIVELHGQCEGKDAKQGLAAALDSADPLELDAVCWFYLDPFVSPSLSIPAHFGWGVFA